MTPLPPDVARTIRSSCKPLLEHQERFHGDFHASLVELMPEVPLMREQTGEQVSRWLVECVLWAVNADEPLPMIGATLQGIGLDAHRLGFPRDGYQAVGHALLRTVRGAFPADWSGTLSSSWIGYHAWLCEYWVSGADIGSYEDQTQPRGLTFRPVDTELAGGAPQGRPNDGLDDGSEAEKGSTYGRRMMSMTRSLSRTGRKR
jgi:hemoglobin-like flavoprotein